MAKPEEIDFGLVLSGPSEESEGPSGDYADDAESEFGMNADMALDPELDAGERRRAFKAAIKACIAEASD